MQKQSQWWITKEETHRRRFFVDYHIFRLISRFSGPNFLTEFSGVCLFREYTLNQTILEIKMSLAHQFTAFSTILHFVTYLHFALPYFALCTIGIVFARAIKMDKICIFCFKLPQNIIMPSAKLIWRCVN